MKPSGQPMPSTSEHHNDTAARPALPLVPLTIPQPAARKSRSANRGRTYVGPHAPGDFIIPARDHQGQSVRIWTHIQPQHERGLYAVLNSKAFPFKSAADVVRLGIHLVLKHLEELEPVLSVTGKVEAMLDILRTEQAAADFNSFLNTAAAVINRHLTDGAQGEARRLISDLRRRIMEMPRGYWKRKYLAAVQQQWGYLLDGSRDAIDLSAFADDDEEGEGKPESEQSAAQQSEH